MTTQNIFDLVDTWALSGGPYTSIKMNATDNDAASASLLMDLQVGTVSKFSVSKAGAVYGTLIGSSTATFGVSSSTGIGFYSTNRISILADSQVAMYFGNNQNTIPNGRVFGFEAGASAISDTILTRRGTANLRFGAADVGATTATVTITIAAPGVVTWTGHGLSTGTPVVFTTTGALPTGITSGTTYYAVVVDANTFQIASSVANAIAATPTVITTSGSQSGTHTGTRYNITQRLSMQSNTGVTDRLGADLFIQGSQGTGTGAGGSIIFQVAPAGGSGTAQNALATALTIDSSQITTAIALKVAESSGRIYLGGNSGGTGTNLYANGGTSIFFTFNGSQTVSLNSTGPQVYNSGSFSWSSVATGNGTPDVLLYRDAANTLALRNGAAAQAFNIYNTYSNGGVDYERVSLLFDSNVAALVFNAGGSGAIRNFQLGGTANGTNANILIDNSNKINFRRNSTNRWLIDDNGHFLAGTDDTYDIGASGATRPRSVYAGTSITPGAGVVVASLPTPSTGMIARVTNALAPATGATVVGGGAAQALVWYNGANWTVIGV